MNRFHRDPGNLEVQDFTHGEVLPHDLEIIRAAHSPWYTRAHAAMRVAPGGTGEPAARFDIVVGLTPEDN